MKTEQNKRKIRNLLINPTVQMKIISYNVFFMMVAVILTVTLVYDHVYKMFMFTPFGALPIELYAILFIIVVLYVYIQMFITHQFCGALVNFVNSFKVMAKGDLTRKVILRKHDLLKTEAIEFNEMIENLTGMISAVKEDHSLVISLLKEIIANTNTETVEKARKVLEDKGSLIAENMEKLIVPGE